MRTNLKSSLIFFILMGISTSVLAQTEKGSILIGGSSSLNFTSLSGKVESGNYSGDGSKISSLELSPGAGYFIFNNLAVGVQFSLSSASEKEIGDKYTESTTMLFPFARLYFGKSNIKPFVQAAYGPGWQKWQYNDNDKERENLTGYELTGGLAFFLNRNISFDISLGYASATAKFTDYRNVDINSTASGTGGNIGFSIFF